MTRKIFRQIMAIRDSGATNMFDVRTVQYLANEWEFYELVVYLEDHKQEYFNFIMTGEAPMEDEDDDSGEEDSENDSEENNSCEDDFSEDYDPDEEDC